MVQFSIPGITYQLVLTAPVNSTHYFECLVGFRGWYVLGLACFIHNQPK